MLPAHFLGRALEEQHPRAVHQLQPAFAGAGQDAPLTGGRSEHRDFFAHQHAHRHGEEAGQMRRRHGFNFVAGARLEFPARGRPRRFELRIHDLDQHIGLAFAIANAQGEQIAFPHGELNRGLRHVEGIDRLRGGHRLENAARHAADGFVGQGFGPQ
jgi:hypothetical protein